MAKWFEEKILIAYWEENCKKYKLPDGRRILRAERNIPLDAYPDIAKNELDTGEIVPCEIEWATSKFAQHKHDIDVLIDSGGFLVTLIENSAFDVPQITIDEKDFVNWIGKKGKKLAIETLESIKKSTSRRTDTFVWIIYISSRGKKDYQEAFENGVWGFPEDNKKKRRGLEDIKDIREGDFIVFVREFKSDDDNRIATPRIKDLSQFVGSIKEIVGVRVTKGYYFNNNIKIWAGRTYPHRFEFDKESLFKASEVPFSPEKFGNKLHAQIAARINANTIEHIDSSMFLKIMNICAEYKN